MKGSVPPSIIMHCYFNSSSSLDVCIINIIKLEKSKYFPSVSKLSSKTTLNIENENASSSLSAMALKVEPTFTNAQIGIKSCSSLFRNKSFMLDEITYSSKFVMFVELKTHVVS